MFPDLEEDLEPVQGGGAGPGHGPGQRPRDQLPPHRGAALTRQLIWDQELVSSVQDLIRGA